tara:strand:- start:151966 stop:152553 length:588 start_codon:yes stop_codon:yes gene_type:complete
MLKLFPNRNQWKRWSLPSKLGAIGTFIAIILAPFTVWSFFTPNTIVYNIYNSTNTEVVREKTVENENTDEDLTKKTNVIKPVFYSLIGNNNLELIKELERKKRIKITNVSSNKISFAHTGSIFVYGDTSNMIFKSRKGSLKILVNGCQKICDELVIPSFGPAPKSIIEQEINKEIEKIVNQNFKYISKKIHECID